jgi:hypothetical protein
MVMWIYTIVMWPKFGWVTPKKNLEDPSIVPCKGIKRRLKDHFKTINYACPWSTLLGKWSLGKARNQ